MPKSPYGLLNALRGMSEKAKDSPKPYPTGFALLDKEKLREATAGGREASLRSRRQKLETEKIVKISKDEE
ncbi:MAG: hypothetical protein JWL80_612 [Parcubacteria group bacterium]|nr:hypothetical protein [Parcubacteria group bacterium]